MFSGDKTVKIMRLLVPFPDLITNASFALREWASPLDLADRIRISKLEKELN